MVRRRRGSLLGTVARTAVITKTASRVAHNEADRAEAKRAAAQPQQSQFAQAPVEAPPAAAEPSTDDVIAQLKKFAELRDAGILTDEEFAAQKAKLLG